MWNTRKDMMSLNFHSLWGPPADPLADTFFLCLTKESLNVLHFALQISAEKERKPYKYSNYAFYEFFFSLYRYLASGQSALPWLLPWPDNSEKPCPPCAAIKKAMIERTFALSTHSWKWHNTSRKSGTCQFFMEHYVHLIHYLLLFMCLNGPASVLITKFWIGFQVV